eukprot:GHVQ01009819.1.p2 GENE.GHVQ01009819.1~~GHVQ01009819.1.p2  ORF type:complete len:103 (+),score=5.49 GHVQ01009819.1:232-540(+)
MGLRDSALFGHYWPFLSIIGHLCSRVSAVDVVHALKTKWVSHFGAPEALLVDRGSSCLSKLFAEFVRNERTAHLVYYGAGYPQGNGVNEASLEGYRDILDCT